MRLASMVLMVVVLALLTLGECGRKKKAVGRVNKITQYTLSPEEMKERRKEAKRERDRLRMQQKRSDRWRRGVPSISTVRTTTLGLRWRSCVQGHRRRTCKSGSGW